MMLKVLDKERKGLAYLENAFNIVEELKINSINFLNFSMPANDSKNVYLKTFNLIETAHGLYRILNVTENEEEMDILDYEAEHVIATLLDHVIFGDVIIGNLGFYTDQVIEYVLSKQKTKNWALGDCDFSRQFEYCWENENLAAALFSIPKPLEDDYIWKFDTSSYPWKVSLKRIKKEDPKFHIMPRKNQISLKAISNPKDLCTRIYPLGYGEGVNQLTIKDINDGIPYLQAEQKYIDKYGLHERIWIDRRYENVESLRDAAQVMLDKLKEQIMEFDVDFSLFEDDEIELGNVVNVNNKYTDIIIGVQYNYDDITSSKVTIANDMTSIAGTVADLADRQRIEMTYSQGATQLYAQSIQVNADSKDGAELNFYIPQEMRVINKVVAKVKIDSFRAYSKAIKGGGASTPTTSGGGGTTTSTGFGGYKEIGKSTYGGGSSDPTTSVESYINNGKGHNHGITEHVRLKFEEGYVGYNQWLASGDHYHRISIKDHTHGFEFTIPSHSHQIKLDDHTHNVTLKDHTHEIEFGIFRRYGTVNSFDIKVNGKYKETIFDRGIEIDLTEMLLNDKNVISRGTWHSVEIVPSDLAYVTIDLFFQGFVQSRGDYTV